MEAFTYLELVTLLKIFCYVTKNSHFQSTFKVRCSLGRRSAEFGPRNEYQIKDFVAFGEKISPQLSVVEFCHLNDGSNLIATWRMDGKPKVNCFNSLIQCRR